MLTVKHGIGAFLCIGKSAVRNKTACQGCVSKLIYPIRTQGSSESHKHDPLLKIWRERVLAEIFLLGALLKLPTKTTSCIWLWLLFASRVDK